MASGTFATERLASCWLPLPASASASRVRVRRDGADGSSPRPVRRAYSPAVELVLWASLRRKPSDDPPLVCRGSGHKCPASAYKIGGPNPAAAPSRGLPGSRIAESPAGSTPRRVTLTERSEVNRESRRQPAVSIARERTAGGRPPPSSMPVVKWARQAGARTNGRAESLAGLLCALYAFSIHDREGKTPATRTPLERGAG